MKTIEVKEKYVIISAYNEYIKFSRRSQENNLFRIRFSMPVSPRMADLIDKSGIVEVVEYDGSGKMTFRKKPFFETHLFSEILIDIIERYHDDNTNEHNYRLL